MAFIHPNSDVIILRDVPLDETYEHTIYFNRIQDQEAYFKSKRKASHSYSMGSAPGTGGEATETLYITYELNNYTYQRSGDRTIRLNIPADCLYDCNYLMYRNTAFGSKWFYGFIQNVRYVNTHVTEITISIDFMQTWFMFGCTLKPCFIVRQHTPTDEIGENIIEEDVDLGDEYVQMSRYYFDLNAMNICVLETRTLTGDDIPAYQSKIINGIYVPCRIKTYQLNNSADITALESELNARQEDEIIMIYQYPAIFGTDETHPSSPTGNTINIPIPNNVSGYTPKNNKLLTYPYIMLTASNNCGNTGIFRWEDSTATATIGGVTNVPVIEFKIEGTFITTPCVICSPVYYRNFGPNVPDYSSALTYSNFPQCAWSGDTFKAWWAQNKGSMASGIFSEVLAAAGQVFRAKEMYDTGAATSNLATSSNAATSGAFAAVAAGAIVADGVAKYVGKVGDIKNTPSQMHGQVTTDSLNVALQRQRFDFFSMGIKSQYARIIDDYFSKYGYAIHRVATPNINARPYWTYVQTLGCFIEGNAPAEANKLICQTFDKGITFWRYGGIAGTNVGDYSQDNSPI